MNKHTPGPWQAIDGRDVGIDRIFVESADSIICRIENRVSKRPLTDEDSANAKLISAAPDLLDALEEVVQWIERGDFEESFLAAARAAIAKARGEA